MNAPASAGLSGGGTRFYHPKYKTAEGAQPKMAGNPFGAISNNFVRSPLGIIALFIVLVYAMAALVTTLGNVPEAHLLVLVLFLALFPVLVLFVFFVLVTRYPNVLYGPGDFQEETNFLRLRGLSDDSSTVLHEFWKPDGKAINAEQNRAIIQWMRSNGLTQISVPVFLRSSKFEEHRKRAIADLGLR